MNQFKKLREKYSTLNAMKLSKQIEHRRLAPKRVFSKRPLIKIGRRKPNPVTAFRDAKDMDKRILPISLPFHREHISQLYYSRGYVTSLSTKFSRRANKTGGLEFPRHSPRIRNGYFSIDNGLASRIAGRIRTR